MENRLTSQTFASRASPVTLWQRLQQRQPRLISKNQLALTWEKKPPLLSFPLWEVLLYQHRVLEKDCSLCVHKQCCTGAVLYCVRTCSCNTLCILVILESHPLLIPLLCEKTYLRKFLINIFSCPSFKPSYLVWSTEWELPILLLLLHSLFPFPIPFSTEVHDTNVIALIFSTSFWEREYFFF